MTKHQILTANPNPKKSWYGPACALAIATCLALWMSLGPKVEPSGDEPIASSEVSSLVQVELVAPQSRPNVLTLTGVLAAAQTYDVVFSMPGTVADLHRSEGDNVRAGDAVLTVESAAAKAELQAARARLTQAETAFDRSASLSNAGSLSRSALEEQAAQLAEARARVERAEADIVNLTMRAPIDGVLTRLHVVPGMTIQPGMAAFRLIDTTQGRFVANAPHKTEAQIREGQEVRIDLGAGKEIPGSVLRIVPETSASGMREVEITLAGVVDAVGAPGYAHITTGVETLHPVPVSALVLKDNGDLSIFTNDQGQARQNNVELVAIDTEAAWVRGLSGTIQVITRGQNALTDGQKITASP